MWQWWLYQGVPHVRTLPSFCRRGWWEDVRCSIVWICVDCSGPVDQVRLSGGCCDDKALWKQEREPLGRSKTKIHNWLQTVTIEAINLCISAPKSLKHTLVPETRCILTSSGHGNGRCSCVHRHPTGMAVWRPVTSVVCQFWEQFWFEVTTAIFNVQLLI